MNIQQQGNSLIAQLITVRTDINNNTLGQACSDLSIFAGQVTAQTGKKITVDQAAKLQAWVGYLSKSIPCSWEGRFSRGAATRFRASLFHYARGRLSEINIHGVELPSRQL